MPASVVNNSTHDFPWPSTSGSWQHTCAAGTNLTLFVCTWDITITNPVCTWDGGATTYLGNATNGIGAIVYFWYVRNPVIGVAKTVAISWTNNGTAGGHAIDIASAHAATNPTLTGATGNSATPTVNVATTVPHLLVDGATMNTPNSVTTPTAGQTLIAHVEAGGTSYRYAAANPQAMSWNSTGADSWAIAGASIPPGPAGNQAIFIGFRRMQEFLRELRAGLIPPTDLQRRYRDLLNRGLVSI